MINNKQNKQKQESVKKSQQSKRNSSPQIVREKINKEKQNITNQAFYTELPAPFLQSDHSKAELQQYLQNLQKKINDAFWKQQLLLEYNYMPLQLIKQKIQFQKQVYQQKINLFKDQHAKNYQNQTFLQQLKNLRQFNLKLKDKMKKYQIQIQQKKVNNQLLKIQTNQRKQKLKQLIKANMQLGKKIAQQLGVKNKQDLIKIIKSKSAKNFTTTTNSFRYKNQSLGKKQISQDGNQLKRLSSAKSSLNSKRGKTLFDECLDKLILSIKSMRSGQDIQSGIYLQIMDKKRTNFLPGHTSNRSTISNTLHQRYQFKIHKMNNKHFQQEDFQIDWQTFKQLNWKQMLGVIMVKDKNCQKIRKIFKKIQLSN